MNARRSSIGAGWLLAIFFAIAPSQQALACAVCFGDPESSMAKGAVAGVFVLLGVVVFVLGSMTGVGFYFVHRSRQIISDEASVGETEAGDVRPGS